MAEAVLRLSKMATNAAVASSAALMRTILAMLRPWLTVLEVAELAATGVSVGAGVKSIEVGVAVALGNTWLRIHLTLRFHVLFRKAWWPSWYN